MHRLLECLARGGERRAVGAELSIHGGLQRGEGFDGVLRVGSGRQVQVVR